MRNLNQIYQTSLKTISKDPKRFAKSRNWVPLVPLKLDLFLSRVIGKLSQPSSKQLIFDQATLLII